MKTPFQIHFSGPITPASVEVLRNAILDAITNKGAKDIQILMSSEGGDLNSGFTAYNYIRAFARTANVSVVNMGTIESIAVMPFLAADDRMSVKHARFLLHNFTWTFPHAPIDINRVYENVQSLDYDVERYVRIFEERTANAKTPIDVRAHLLGRAVIINPESAFSSGILTRDIIHDPDISGSAGTVWTQICK